MEESGDSLIIIGDTAGESVTFTYGVQDSDGLMSSATVIVSVDERPVTNVDAIVSGISGPTNVFPNTSNTYFITANDTDNGISSVIATFNGDPVAVLQS